MSNPFMNFKADANVSIPVYNELLGQHKVSIQRVVVTQDNTNLEGIPSEELARDWTDHNYMVYMLLGNELGIYHHHNYYYGNMKFDQLRMNPDWNQLLHLFRISTCMTTQPYAIYIGDVPIEYELRFSPDHVEKMTLNPGNRVAGVRETAYARQMYSAFCKAAGLPGVDNPMLLEGKELYIDIKEHWFGGRKKKRLHQFSSGPFNGMKLVGEEVVFAKPKVFGEKPDEEIRL